MERISIPTFNYWVKGIHDDGRAIEWVESGPTAMFVAVYLTQIGWACVEVTPIDAPLNDTWVNDPWKDEDGG